MQFETIIFDLDGTLVDSSEGIFNSVKSACEELNLRQPNDSELRSFIGPPVPDSFMRIHGLADAAAQEATLVFRKYYLTQGIFEARVFEGVSEVLAKLSKSNLNLAVATYKRESAAKRVLEHFGLAEFFGVVFGADAAHLRRKSHMILDALTFFDTPPQRAVLVGDTLHDLQGAREVKVEFVPVLWGFGFENEADAAAHTRQFVAKTPREILRLVD